MGEIIGVSLVFPMMFLFAIVLDLMERLIKAIYRKAKRAK